MPSCQICGKDADSLKKVKIEGAKLDVCDSCSDMGEEVKTSSRKGKRRKTQSPGPRTEKVLVGDYGSRIKQARENEGISIKELADELNEKSSLLSKLEKQDLKPDNALAEKLEKRLDLDLYTMPTVHDYDAPSSDSRKATLGDVAKVND